MTSNEFIIWLDGFIAGAGELKSEQIEQIKKKLDTVQPDVSPVVVPVPMYPSYPYTLPTLPYYSPQTIPDYPYGPIYCTSSGDMNVN